MMELKFFRYAHSIEQFGWKSRMRMTGSCENHSFPFTSFASFTHRFFIFYANRFFPWFFFFLSLCYVVYGKISRVRLCANATLVLLPTHILPVCTLDVREELEGKKTKGMRDFRKKSHWIWMCWWVRCVLTRSCKCGANSNAEGENHPTNFVENPFFLVSYGTFFFGAFAFVLK